MKKQSCPHCLHLIHRPRTGWFGKKIHYCPICGASWKSAQFFQYRLHESPAALFARFLARTIDYTIIAILASLCDVWTNGAFLDSMMWFQEGVQNIPQVDYALFLALVLSIGYFVIFHGLTGQTPGKLLCQIIVLQDGRRLPGIITSLVREAAIWLTFLTGGWLLLILFLSSKKRGFQDILSRSNVYQSQETAAV